MALSDEMADFVRSLGGGMLCTRDAQNRPYPHECFLAEVTCDHVIGLVPAHLGRGLEENVSDNGRASLVVSRVPGDHRSAQLKGRITALDGARLRESEFQPVVEPMVSWFRKMMPEQKARHIMSAAARTPMYRLRFEIEQAFNQSPGPQAGRALAGGER